MTAAGKGISATQYSRVAVQGSKACTVDATGHGGYGALQQGAHYRITLQHRRRKVTGKTLQTRGTLA